MSSVPNAPTGPLEEIVWPRTARRGDDGVISIAGIAATDLADRFGTPAYVIDEDDVPPLSHPGPGWRVDRLESIRQVGEQVVIAERAQPALAGLELDAHGQGEPDPRRRNRIRVIAGWFDDRGRIADRVRGDQTGDLMTEWWRCRTAPETLQIDVVDDLAQ